MLANEPGSDSDIALKDGDTLLIPQRTQEVTVLGEVQYATSHIYNETLDRDDYVARSGGLTSKADAKRIYVVRANGQVVATDGSRWLRRVGGTEIRAGDTIVVPIDADRIAPLTLWSSVTQIVFNLAVAVSAVNSF
ncbi:MAG: capsule biosynthesis GfcC family protein [Pseudomonadota bacterium]